MRYRVVQMWDETRVYGSEAEAVRVKSVRVVEWVHESSEFKPGTSPERAIRRVIRKIGRQGVWWPSLKLVVRSELGLVEAEAIRDER